MTTDEEKTAQEGADNAGVAGDPEKPGFEPLAKHLQRGVQDVEAVTLSWSKTSLILVFLK